ncbi:MAG: glutaredoxin-like protein [Parcubacteria group bacterium Gr01-1014_17]|nr:MAG: glutaredoxin-like protein [Parcubacteria group bacterium Gr01-1014_17]
MRVARIGLASHAWEARILPLYYTRAYAMLADMKNIIIYSTPTCVYCNAAKKFFAENGTVFTEYNVASDMQKRQEMIEKSGQMGVPVITVGSRVIVGFNRPVLEEALAN